MDGNTLWNNFLHTPTCSTKSKNIMKSIKTVFSVIGLGLLLGMAACNSGTTGDGATESMDSTGMDNTQTEMQADTMATDTATTL
jgi:hypothetical protein